MRLRMIAFVSMILLVFTYGLMAWAKKPKPIPPVPQASVVCTGWHALCSAADDCVVVVADNVDVANCACWRVKEPHIVETSKIQDPEVLLETQRRCTTAHPCDVDEAPVCAAIKNGQFEVDHETYQWVSTYSYRGWCETFSPADCSGQWADCMSAPCVEYENPVDYERPLSCQCRLENSAFVGINGTCYPSGNGDVQSTIARELWDFNKDTFTIPPPGYEYVRGACATLESDLQE